MNALEMLDEALGQGEGRLGTVDAATRARVERLSRRLTDLLDDGEAPRPPDDLAQRTLDLVFRPATLEFIPAPRRSTFTWRDLAVAAAVFLGSLGVVLPATFHARERNRSLLCMDNLRQVGLATLRQADVKREIASQPAITGGERFASLVDEGYLDKLNVFDCPSGGHQARWQHVAGTPLTQTAPDFARTCDYAVHVGCRGTHADQRRSAAIPLIADAPRVGLDGRPRARGNSDNHNGRGQHVLFSDLSARFAETRAVPLDDDIYLNRASRPALGVDPDDAVILPAPMRCSEY